MDLDEILLPESQANPLPFLWLFSAVFPLPFHILGHADSGVELFRGAQLHIQDITMEFMVPYDIHLYYMIFSSSALWKHWDQSLSMYPKLFWSSAG